MYEHTSMHVHPAYGGVRQNDGLTREDIYAMLYVSCMQCCFVTSLFIKDFKARYEQPGKYYELMEEKHKQIIESFITKANA